jgi:hypothetical protein
MILRHGGVDLDEILADHKKFQAGTLKDSEYRFKIRRSQIGESLCINPQFYLPNLNKTIRDIEAIDGKNGWTVTTIGQIAQGVTIFNGPRIKTENIVVETAAEANDRWQVFPSDGRAPREIRKCEAD